MIRYLLQSTGIEEKLLTLKAGIETQAQYFLTTGKAALVSIAFASGLFFAACILFLMAVTAACISTYFWLLPQIGSVWAAAAIGSGLLLLSAIIGIAGTIVTRRMPAFELPATSVRAPISPAEAESRRDVVNTSTTAQDVDRMFTAAGQIVRFPKTGVEPLDQILAALAPKAQEVAEEAVERAAGAVRNGDRSTILGVLGAALATGWILSRTARQK